MEAQPVAATGFGGYEVSSRLKSGLSAFALALGIRVSAGPFLTGTAEERLRGGLAIEASLLITVHPTVIFSVHK
jgi:hypothetical protein